MSLEENRELEGVLNPSKTIDMSTRSQFLEVQEDHYNEKLKKTIEKRDNAGDPAEFIELEERVIGLREARDLTIRQKRLEEVRE